MYRKSPRANAEGAVSASIRSAPRSKPRLKAKYNVKKSCQKQEYKKSSPKVYKKLTADVDKKIEADEKISHVDSASQFAATQFDVCLLEREELRKYGWNRFTPDCLQWCRDPRVLLAVLGFMGMAHGFFIAGIFPASISSLRRRFHFTMQDFAAIRTLYDVGIIVMHVPIMYFNARGAHRGFVLGIGCFIASIGIMLCVLPHFIVGPYDYDDRAAKSADHFCEGGSSASISISNFSASIDAIATEVPEVCEHSDVRSYKYAFMAGLFLFGVGCAPYHTVGMAYIDENVSNRMSIIYTGVLNVCWLFGASVGMSASGHILNIYCDVNIGRTGGTLNPDHGHWVGAWWIGMSAAAALQALSALPIFGFPRLVSSEFKAHVLEAIREEVFEVSDRDAKKGERTVWQSVKACLTNLTYVGLIIERCAYLLIVISFGTFLPVYVETVFEVPARDAAKFVGGVIVVSSIIGSICGTLFQHSFYFQTTENLRFALATALATLVFLAVLFIDCPQTDFAGATTPYPINGTDTMSLHSSCNQGCRCNQDYFDPVCYEPSVADSVNDSEVKKPILYFSKCFAGCADVNGTDCKCVPGGNLSSKDKCQANCHVYRMYAALTGLAWCTWFIFVRINPMQQCLLRCISFKDRIAGLTLSAVISRVFAAVPSPPIFGAILHNSCAAWQTWCGEETLCEWRDKKSLVNDVTWLAFVISAIGIVGLAVANYGYKDPRKKTKGNDEPPRQEQKTSSVKSTSASLLAQARTAKMPDDDSIV